MNKEDTHCYQFVRASCFEFINSSELKYDCLVKKDLYDNLNKFFKEFRSDVIYNNHSHQFWTTQKCINYCPYFELIDLKIKNKIYRTVQSIHLDLSLLRVSYNQI